MASRITPFDPLDREKLPCDVRIGGVVFRKGLPLRTLVNAAARWRKMAHEAPFNDRTPEEIEEAKQQFRGLLEQTPEDLG